MIVAVVGLAGSFLGVSAAVSVPAFATTANGLKGVNGSRPVLSVNGEVTSPSAYTISQLVALPQTTVTVTAGGRQFTDTGVLLETLVSDAGPAYPASLLNTKNDLLRVTVTVRGAGRRDITFAVGELDPGFGSHPALLALTQNGRPIARGPELVVPGDRAPVRFVPRVTQLTVGIAPPPPPTPIPRPPARSRSSTAITR